MKWWSWRRTIVARMPAPGIFEDRNPVWMVVTCGYQLFLRPGDSIQVTSHNTPFGQVIAEVLFDKETNGQFHVTLKCCADGEHRMRLVYPDGSEKLFRPPTEGRYWVEVI